MAMHVSSEIEIFFSPGLFGREREGISPLMAWLDRQRQRVHLSYLDDRLLCDIGVSQVNSEAECRRWT